MAQELCYLLEELPDLTLDQYASLEGGGVEAVLEKHVAFLRQWNRKGVLTGVSLHLFYYYIAEREAGARLSVLLLVRGDEAPLKNVPEMIASSPLSPYFRFIDTLIIDGKREPLTIGGFEKACGIAGQTFPHMSALSKKEAFIRPSYGLGGDEQKYYTIPEWEMQEGGRLFAMCALMGGLNRTLLYRVDLYPVERGGRLRDALYKPIGVLRERQGISAQRTERDYEAETVLRAYTSMLERFDASPHFLVNLFVFGPERGDTEIVLDAAGAESLKKGNYTVSGFDGAFHARSFLDEPLDPPLYDKRTGVRIKSGARGLVVASADPLGDGGAPDTLCELPTLFTLEELAPFFRFPALYDGETLQLPKETAPKPAPRETSLHLGWDDNGYPVFFPLKNLSKHAFLAGVPGSGKTNAMLHIASTLYKREPPIPFLILEPAKREYRALANQPGMEGLYLFSPNADMRFPLHINPFEFPKGLLLAEHISRLVAVFEGAFPLDNPMPFLLDTAIEAVYRALGWTPETVYTDKTRLPFPSMSMLYARLEEELKTTKYSDEIRGNLESALKVRIGSLIRREMGDVFDVPYSTIAPEEWLKIPAVIELESMGAGPANFLTLMICTLIRESLKVDPAHSGDAARHMLFIEEAHNLIGPDAEEVSGNEANPKQAATAFIVKMLAEVRALGEGIVIADQLPTVMAAEVIKNTGLKIGLRITSGDDRALLGSTMAASGMQIEEMATYRVGEALVSYEGLMRPFKVRVKAWRGRGLEGDADCIDDPQAREIAVAPLADDALVESMRTRESYRRTCFQSFMIQAERLMRDAHAMNERLQGSVSRARAFNREALSIKRDNEQADARMASLDPALDDGGDPAECDRILRLLSDVERRNNALDAAIAKSAFQSDVNACLRLLARMLLCKRRWKKLGVDTDRLLGANASEDEAAYCAQARRFQDMARLLILRAQQLYAVGSAYMTAPDAAKSELRRVCRLMEMQSSI